MTEQKPIGQLVRCLNCGLLWRRITEYDAGPGSTGPMTGDQQYNCPACSSNAYVRVWPANIFPSEVTEK